MWEAILKLAAAPFSIWQKKLETAAAIEDNKARLARSKNSNNHEWEMASLQDKDRWLRRISFIIFVWPITPIAALRPDWVIAYYDALSPIPEWNLQIIMIMIGGIWGVSELKNSLPALVGGIKKAIK